MGRGRKKRGGRGVMHHESCVCSRCLDIDAKKLEDQLDAAFEKHVKGKIDDLQQVNITLSVKESPVIGPYDGDDVTKALYVTCPMAIVGTIVPRSRRRK
jgi:hypothetical protein